LASAFDRGVWVLAVSTQAAKNTSIMNHLGIMRVSSMVRAFDDQRAVEFP